MSHGEKCSKHWGNLSWIGQKHLSYRKNSTWQRLCEWTVNYFSLSLLLQSQFWPLWLAMAKERRRKNRGNWQLYRASPWVTGKNVRNIEEIWVGSVKKHLSYRTNSTWQRLCEWTVNYFSLSPLLQSQFWPLWAAMREEREREERKRRQRKA